MRRNLGCLMAILLAWSGLLVSAADISVVKQLDEANYSAEVLGTLPAALMQLQSILTDESLGPRRRLGEDGWTTREFASFAAGSLADRGYLVRIAVAGARAWPIVGLPVANTVVWLPVVSTPLPGDEQKTLGYVPFDAQSGKGQLDAEYLAYDSVSAVPPDSPPKAQFRFSALTVDYGSAVEVLATGSSDPDGRIVLYRWCVDGGPCVATLSWSHLITATSASHVLSVTLFVVDDRGRSASASGTIEVTNLSINKNPPPVTSCGCGGK